MNLATAKREEVQRLKSQIDELSCQYIRNLNDDCSYLLFSESELHGLPPEFLKVSIVVLCPANGHITIRHHNDGHH